MITINGDIYITNYGQPLNELAEDKQFEDFDELDCDGDCEDCDLYESDECDDEEELSIEEIVDKLTTFYAEILSDGCICPECIKKILIDYTKDMLSDISEIE